MARASKMWSNFKVLMEIITMSTLLWNYVGETTFWSAHSPRSISGMLKGEVIPIVRQMLNITSVSFTPCGS